MKTRTLTTVLLLGALVSAKLFAVPAGLAPSMLALDKSYIPALGLTGQADQQAKARVAFAAFQAAWNEFKARYADPADFDAEWTEDLGRVDHAVSAARTALLDRADGPGAHEALEAVRMTFLAARTRLKVPYFIDSLTLYHNAMEALLGDKPSKPLAVWSAADRLGFAADLDIAIARWNKVKAAESLLPGTGLTASAAETYAAQWRTLDAAMGAARKALEAGDEKTLAEKLGALKPNFIKTFFLFGDFPK